MGKFEFEANVQFPFSQFKYFCFRQYDRKCLFNVRHSHARVRMTENIYEILKRRFPISKYIRCYVPNAVRIVQACAVLNNMANVWRDAEPAQPHPNYQDSGAESGLDQPGNVQVDILFIQNILNPRDRRQQGINARENWRLSMDNHPS